MSCNRPRSIPATIVISCPYAIEQYQFSRRQIRSSPYIRKKKKKEDMAECCLDSIHSTTVYSVVFYIKRIGFCSASIASS